PRRPQRHPQPDLVHPPRHLKRHRPEDSQPRHQQRQQPEESAERRHHALCHRRRVHHIRIGRHHAYPQPRIHILHGLRERRRQRHRTPCLPPHHEVVIRWLRLPLRPRYIHRRHHRLTQVRILRVSHPPHHFVRLPHRCHPLPQRLAATQKPPCEHPVHHR